MNYTAKLFFEYAFYNTKIIEHSDFEVMLVAKFNNEAISADIMNWTVVIDLVSLHKHADFHMGKIRFLFEEKMPKILLCTDQKFELYYVMNIVGYGIIC